MSFLTDDKGSWGWWLRGRRVWGCPAQLANPDREEGCTVLASWSRLFVGIICVDYDGQGRGGWGGITETECIVDGVPVVIHPNPSTSCNRTPRRLDADRLPRTYIRQLQREHHFTRGGCVKPVICISRTWALAARPFLKILCAHAIVLDPPANLDMCDMYFT